MTPLIRPQNLPAGDSLVLSRDEDNHFHIKYHWQVEQDREDQLVLGTTRTIVRFEKQGQA